MPSHPTADHQVFEIIIRSPGTAFDEVVLPRTNLTWNQVYLVIDRLNREGVVTLRPKGGGPYSVQVSIHTSLHPWVKSPLWLSNTVMSADIESIAFYKGDRR